MKLIKATSKVLNGIDELLLELGDGEFGFQGSDYARGRMSLTSYLQLLEDMSHGRRLKPGWIPVTTFWCLDDTGRPVGMSRLRHTLTAQTLARGGNIGYYVRPSQRCKGYGTAILAQTLEEARKLGLDRVLLTTDSENAASIRVIMANGGWLEDQRIDQKTGRPYRRYWIELKQAPEGAG